jgi:hypothetical protein
MSRDVFCEIEKQREAQHCADCAQLLERHGCQRRLSSWRPVNPTYTNQHQHLLPRNMVSGRDSTGTRPHDVGLSLYMRRLHPAAWCAHNKGSDGDRMFWNDAPFAEKVAIEPPEEQSDLGRYRRMTGDVLQQNQHWASLSNEGQ